MWFFNLLCEDGWVAGGLRGGCFFRARRRCTQELFYRTVSHVTGPSRWPADMVTVLQTSRQITVLKDTLREAQDGEQMGSGKNLGPAFLFSICKSLVLDSPSLARATSVPCVKHRAEDLQGQSAAGQLFRFAQLWIKWESPSRICPCGRPWHVGSDTSDSSLLFTLRAPAPPPPIYKKIKNPPGRLKQSVSHRLL